jgi:beta-phosphoglucomutase
MDGEWRDIRDQTSWTAERFTPAVYQQAIAGMPRMAGARAAMEYFGVPDIDARIEQYAASKQQHVIKLIEQGRFMAFPDALRFILAVKHMGTRVAAASSSKNAKLFLERIRLDAFAAEQRLDYGFIHPGMTLQELFDADISGRDFPKGKPDPTIFLTAAEELGVGPGDCFVTEDASSGIQAAKAGGMAALGVARLDDRDLLLGAGAGLVVPTLDDVALEALADGRLEERRAAAELRRRYTQRPPSVWTLVYDGFDPARQGLREALCALGNGYFVARGALPEAEADGVNYPGTYVAGLYNRLVTEIARAQGRERGSGQCPQLAAPGPPGRRRGVVRRSAGRRPRPPVGAGHAPRDAHPAAALAGPGRAPHAGGSAPAGEHEGRASRRAGDHLHGGELVGDPGGPLRAGRQGGQRGGRALPRPERPPSGRAGPGPGEQGDG